MKPDWKDAPEWAQWLAQDYDGDWYWYENRPFTISNCWIPGSGNSQLAQGQSIPDWDVSLEQRPAEQPCAAAKIEQL